MQFHASLSPNVARIAEPRQPLESGEAAPRPTGSLPFSNQHDAASSPTSHNTLWNGRSQRRAPEDHGASNLSNPSVELYPHQHMHSLPNGQSNGPRSHYVPSLPAHRRYVSWPLFSETYEENLKSMVGPTNATSVSKMRGERDHARTGGFTISRDT